jgi:gluconate kinase
MTPAVVWISGISGAGKTFMGDYLAYMSGFYHIDGDSFAHSSEPNERQLFQSLIEAFYKHWFLGLEAPEELWHPYLLHQFERIRTALGQNEHVVISLSVYHRQVRDFIRMHFPQHCFILLQCNEEELLRRAKVRFAKYADANGKSVEEMYEDLYKEAYSEAKWQARTLNIHRGMQPLEADETMCHNVDVSDKQPYNQIHMLLGLSPPASEIPVDEIAAMNYDRFKSSAKI